MKRFALTLVLMIFWLAGNFTAAAQTEGNTSSNSKYDVVILNGRVMDPETNFDGIRNVGIKDGIIKTITKNKISGKEVIDAKGMVVAPGFIDTHIHGISKLGRKLLLLDGVTTGLSMEYGVLDVDKFYNERKKWRANYGANISLNHARMKVLDHIDAQDDIGWIRGMKDAEKNGSKWSTKIPTPEEEKQIMAILKKGLDRGAIGVGMALGYQPVGTPAMEVYQAQKLAASYGRVTAAHTRFGSGLPPDEFVLGGHELMLNAVALKAPAIFQHFHHEGWEQSAELIKSLQEQGYNIWGEVYPYAAYSTLANAAFLAPENFKKNGQEISKTVLDPSTGKYLTEEQLVKMRKEDPGHLLVVFAHDKNDIPKWLSIEGATIGSDSMVVFDSEGNLLPEDAPYEKVVMHPRGAGAHARALRYAREYNIPLMTVVANLSYWSAKHLGDTGLESMKVRGRIQKGMVADIAIFDPKTVTDKADYITGKNGLPSEGIPYVLVNGVITIKDSQLVPDAYAGQPIRFPVRENSK